MIRTIAPILDMEWSGSSNHCFVRGMRSNEWAIIIIIIIITLIIIIIIRKRRAEDIISLKQCMHYTWTNYDRKHHCTHIPRLSVTLVYCIKTY